ncbi:MAG TPA: signal peptidase I [Acidobacteriota bacterium]|nr:signal peptidase I [Acidobacteriota bacterium]
MQKSTLREYLESILIAAILALFIRTFVFQAFKIPTGSMEPNLLVGDHIVVNKFVYGPGGSGSFMLPTAEINRGDVIVFRAPQEPDKDFIKRVVGIGGDKIEVRDGVVLVNDEIVDEPFALHTSNFGSHRDYGPIQVPEGEYFCMGDNRDNSRDSRYWGTVPRRLVKGRAVAVYWSFDAPSRTYFASGFGDRLVQLGKLLPSFFTRTRWERTFQMIR